MQYMAAGLLFRKHRNQVFRSNMCLSRAFCFSSWVAMSSSSSSSSSTSSSAEPSPDAPKRKLPAAKARAKPKGEAKAKPKARGERKSAEEKLQADADRRQREKTRRQALAKAQGESNWRAREGLGRLEALPPPIVGSSLPVEWHEDPGRSQTRAYHSRVAAAHNALSLTRTPRFFFH